MAKFNLSTRIELFAICSSIEEDIKNYIFKTNDKLVFTQNMEVKAKERERNTNLNNPKEILDQLDLKDFVELIKNSPYEFSFNNEKVKILINYFEKIIPVRNRVMHTKPLELGDRSLLIEIMEKIDIDINWIHWLETIKMKNIISTDPTQLLSKRYIPLKEINTSIYHNLPEPEFDDTGYIGRNRDRKEITDLILNNKNQIITIVGNGGVGKTATVVKTLYDLIESPLCNYECIIWITLKSKTLSNGEFIQIKDCIKSIPEIYSFSQSVIISDDNIPSQDMLIKFMDEFRVLLVLDNLETINSGDINVFLKNIPEKSKVLITSRHGVGELEIRKKLDGLEKQDTILYFRELSKYYGLDLFRRSDKEIFEITNNILYSNPLSIKWYITGVFNGMSENQLISNKEELINFCISNVFEKLSEIPKIILQIFLLEKVGLSYGTIDYYLEVDAVILRESINELLSTYMINSVSGEFIMNNMSREYISINYPPTNDLVAEIFKKRKILKSIIQNVKVQSEQAPFNPQSISSNLSDVDRQLSAYYLQKALLKSKDKLWEEAKYMCNKAMNISPNFFETYKIIAFIEAERSEYYGAISNYEIALLKCETNKEKAIVLTLFSTFYTIKMQDLDLALEYIEKADKLLPDTSEILLEKARVYMYLGKYDDSEILLNRIVEVDKEPVLRTQNIMASRYAELYRRKAEILENRDFIKKRKLFNLGICHLNNVQTLDIKSGITLVLLLHDLAYLYFDKEAIDLLANTIEKQFKLLCTIKHNKKEKMCEFLRLHKNDINSDIYNKIERFINNYKFISGEIDKENEGIVTSLKDYFGFISNSIYKTSNSIFFLKSHAFEDIKVGDKVSFEIYDGKKGKAAKKVVKI